MSPNITLEPQTKNLDLYITQGTDYQIFFLIKDSAGEEIDCSEWTAKSQIRDKPISKSGGIKAEFSTEFQLSENGIQSVLALTLPKAESVKLVKESFFWDLDLIDPDGKTRTPYGGLVIVTLQYTE